MSVNLAPADSPAPATKEQIVDRVFVAARRRWRTPPKPNLELLNAAALHIADFYGYTPSAFLWGAIDELVALSRRPLLFWQPATYVPRRLKASNNLDQRLVRDLHQFAKLWYSGVLG